MQGKLATDNLQEDEDMEKVENEEKKGPQQPEDLPENQQEGED